MLHCRGRKLIGATARFFGSWEQWLLRPESYTYSGFRVFCYSLELCGIDTLFVAVYAPCVVCVVDLRCFAGRSDVGSASSRSAPSPSHHYHHPNRSTFSYCHCLFTRYIILAVTLSICFCHSCRHRYPFATWLCVFNVEPQSLTVICSASFTMTIVIIEYWTHSHVPNALSTVQAPGYERKRPHGVLQAHSEARYRARDYAYTENRVLPTTRKGAPDTAPDDKAASVETVSDANHFKLWQERLTGNSESLVNKQECIRSLPHSSHAHNIHHGLFFFSSYYDLPFITL